MCNLPRRCFLNKFEHTDTEPMLVPSVVNRMCDCTLLFSSDTHTHTHTHTHTTSTIEHRYVPTQFGLVYLSNMPRNRGFNLSDYRIRERQQDICLLMCNAVTEIQTEAMMVSFLRKNIVLSNAMIENLKIIHFCSEIGEDVSTSTWCSGV